MKTVETLIHRISGSTDSYVDPFERFKLDQPLYEIGRSYFKVNPSVKFGGFQGTDFNSPEDIYDLIDTRDMPIVCSVTLRLIDYINEKMVPHPFQSKSFILFRVKGKLGKSYTYCRECGINGFSENGEMAFNYTFMRDVSWMSPKMIGAVKLEGPGSEGFDMDIPEIALFNKTLTPRELEILKLIARGFSSFDISRMLKISKYTVDTHRKNMLRKLEVANSSELLTLAADFHLLD